MTDAAKTADDAAETIIELVETVPMGYVLLAALLGGAIVFVAMMAVSKPPTPPTE